jgi:hypothetical protein
MSANPRNSLTGASPSALQPQTPPGSRRGYRPTVLQRQLLLVALSDPDSAAEAWKSVPEGFWLELERGSFELMALVYGNLAQTCPDEPLLPRLKGIYRRSWVKNNLLLRKTSEIAMTLEAGGVRPLFLEGPTHAVRFYGDLALRPTSSIHVLVAASNATEALIQLKHGGWTHRPGSDAYPGWRVLFDSESNVCVLRSSLAFDYIGHSEDPAEEPIWRDADRYDAPGTEVLVPMPTDAFLAACVAGARYGPLPPTQWLTDAVMILRSGELDWDRLVNLAVVHRQHLRLREALGCLLDLPIPVPQRVADAHAWLAQTQPTRRDRLAFALSTGTLARRGGLADSLAELLASTTGESLARTVTRLPGHLCARWGVTHRWQLPVAAGRRFLSAARKA